ncbi:hypothetical protein A3A21_02525 [Candidatus Jorgensenbacteria bacterium RIFCSPLOWO2_01_FULL_45_25b]|uniref:Uncharacterized protein n=1 Tax=Candidatus Jorgensenbacteria bacterium RIFCSPLOWO2_01_FULL_45_25b TaxID=1798471 RepID=A0A1F6BTH8_9BACT|nr:MAG: hypothetical protein A3A21_02525 [Candidatus Jorgensenbacteria bacterium RIFCSPLOWO2_01_FULL_45_25b]
MLKFILVQFFFVVFLIVCFSNTASAIDRQVILTWGAGTLVPASYEGRALPSLRSRVVVSVSLFEDGRVLDLTQADISWSLDNQPYQKGRGLQEISFQINKAQSNIYTVRASVSLRGAVASGVIQIPIVKPRVVLTHPYPKHIVSPGTKVLIRSNPYFFSASSLRELEFGWQIDARPILLSGSESLLNLTVSSIPGGKAEVIGFAKRVGGIGETAKQMLNLYVR